MDCAWLSCPLGHSDRAQMIGVSFIFWGGQCHADIWAHGCSSASVFPWGCCICSAVCSQFWGSCQNPLAAKTLGWVPSFVKVFLDDLLTDWGWPAPSGAPGSSTSFYPNKLQWGPHRLHQHTKQSLCSCVHLAHLRILYVSSFENGGVDWMSRCSLLPDEGSLYTYVV